jgi:uncharacterized membrane protein YphA (DoxX/SURF4 family)
MHLIGQILLGLIMVVGGVLLLKYNYQVSNNLRISFAEQHMGSGGSYLLWKIIGVVVVIAGITVVFGFSDNILAWIFSPITNVVNPSE